MKTFLKVDLGIQIIGLILILAGGSAVIFFEKIELYTFTTYGLLIWQFTGALIFLSYKSGREKRKKYLISSVIFLLLGLPLIWHEVYFLGMNALSVWYFQITRLEYRRVQLIGRSFWDLEF